jgi:hypothetical protein
MHSLRGLAPRSAAKRPNLRDGSHLDAVYARTKRHGNEVMPRSQYDGRAKGIGRSS